MYQFSYHLTINQNLPVPSLLPPSENMPAPSLSSAALLVAPLLSVSLRFRGGGAYNGTFLFLSPTGVKNRVMPSTKPFNCRGAELSSWSVNAKAELEFEELCRFSAWILAVCTDFTLLCCVMKIHNFAEQWRYHTRSQCIVCDAESYSKLGYCWRHAKLEVHVYNKHTG